MAAITGLASACGGRFAAGDRQLVREAQNLSVKENDLKMKHRTQLDWYQTFEEDGHDQFKNVHSILLVKNGKLALEEYFYGTHRNHMHPIQSDTQSVTSVFQGPKRRCHQISISFRSSILAHEHLL